MRVPNFSSTTNGSIASHDEETRKSNYNLFDVLTYLAG